jgi:two-component system response regulator HupR/HoxA
MSESGGSLKDMVENVEKRKIVEAMERTKGNKSRAAEMLGLSRLGLRKKMERYGIASD